MSQLTEDILSNVDIVDIISKYVTLKRSWSNFSAISPFQNEKTPSFMVSPQKQIFKDFSSGIGWNAITFIMEIEKVDFWDAIKILADHAKIDLSKYTNYHEDQSRDEKEKIKHIHKIAYNFFRTQLQQNTQAKTYLNINRKLSNETIELFGIGYAPDSHYALVQELKKHKFTDEDITKASLAKQGQTGDIYSFFRNRITFPIHDTMQNIIGFGARVINPEDKPKYINSADHRAYDKSKTLYGLHLAKNYVRTHNFLIIVEWYMDVIALQRLGFPVGVAPCGTAITTQHIKLIHRYTDTVYFLFDNDKAGIQASIKWLKLSYEQNIFPKLLELPNSHKDIDDLANTQEGKEIFEQALENAKDGFQVMFNIIQTQHDRQSPIGKQKVLNIMFELIMHIENISIQTHYLTILAESMGSRYEIIYPQYKKFVKTEGKLLVHNKSQDEQTQRNQEYDISKDYLVASLVYQDFTTHYQSEPLNHLSKFLEILSNYIPDTLLGQIYTTSLTHEKQKLQEAQLRREKELSEYTDSIKQYRAICKTIHTTVNSYIKAALKNPSLSHEQKQDLLINNKKIFSMK
jgi:DNA primase